MPRASAPTAAASTSWAGAPPVIENGFSFANGEFFADASNQNRHRRATPSELKNHFDKGTDKDHPAHWFEAQLIHYGLQPSKTKSVARMRLFDAVKANALAVPSAVSKLEAKLKKEWNKNDRDAKKALKDAAALQAKPKATAGAKRKAADDGGAASAKAGSKPAAKKTKTLAETTTKTVTKTTTKTTTTKTTVKTPAKPKEASASSSASKKKATPKATTKTTTKTPAQKDAAPPRKIQTARRGNFSQGPSRPAPAAPSSSATPIRPGMARRGGASVARGRIQAPPEQIHLYDDEDDDDEQDHYGGYSDEDEDHGHYSDQYDHRDGYSEDSPPPPYSEYSEGESYSNNTALAPLGLINGDYSLSSSYVEYQWSQYGSSFDLVLTLSGSTLWGRFDLGVVQGIMYFENRPMQSSNNAVPFIWRGREDDGPIMFNNHPGHMTFLGDGQIEGELGFMGIPFRGRRVPGQGTRSSASVNSLQHEWNGYSEEQYERERVSRW